MSEPRLGKVRLYSVDEGLIPLVKSVKIMTFDGLEEGILVSEKLISSNNTLRVLVIKREKKTLPSGVSVFCSLIELPDETFSGLRRIWVESKEMEAFSDEDASLLTIMESITDKNNKASHDGDCWIYAANGVCTCGLLHSIIRNPCSEEYDRFKNDLIRHGCNLHKLNALREGGDGEQNHQG